jgi:hypothetical protein
MQMVDQFCVQINITLTVLHDINHITCSCCGYPLQYIGGEVSEQVEFIPTQIRVIKQVRLKSSRRTCEYEGTTVAIHIAEMPATAYLLVALRHYSGSTEQFFSGDTAPAA